MLEAIEMKCRTQCGMMGAWPDGVCRAEGLCALYPWSPLAASVPQEAQEHKNRAEGWDDL